MTQASDNIIGSVDMATIVAATRSGRKWGNTVMSRGVRRPAGRASGQGVSNGDAKRRPGRSLARTVHRLHSLLYEHVILFNSMFLASDWPSEGEILRFSASK